MSYHTILVHVDSAPHAAARIRHACELARHTGAHLLGVAAIGISRFIFPDDGSGFDHTVLHREAERLRQRAIQALAGFAAQARAVAVSSFETRVAADDAQGALVKLASFCDLVVLSQTDPDLAPVGLPPDLPAWVVMNVARPVLVVPYAANGARLDGTALVAWNGSIEAARAARDALPLLRRAAKVNVAHLSTPNQDEVGAGGADLLAWLERHGVRARLLERPAESDDGDALLSLAMDEQADLIVMGAYGHSRFRELMLGGVTRSVLQGMTAPVLLSH